MATKYSLQGLIYQGETCFRTGNYNNALCWYNRGLKKDPENVDLLTRKGNTLCYKRMYSKAYECYIKALLHAKALDLIDQYIERYRTHLQSDIYNLHELLKMRYNISITLDGLQLVLKKAVEEYDESRRVKEWIQFKKRLQQKHLDSPDKYVDLFLRQYGESFYKHFLSFFCYLSGEKGFPLTGNQFAEIILEQQKKIKLEQFERFIRTGRKQPLLDKMSGLEFERYLTTMFESKGYVVEKTPGSHDYGADLIVDKFGETIAVQAKCRKQAVRITAVQEIHGGRDYYRTRRALVGIRRWVYRLRC